MLHCKTWPRALQLFRCFDPPDALFSDDDQTIAEIVFFVPAQKWQQEVQSSFCGSGIDLEANYAGMAGEWQNRPVAEVFIEGDDDSVVFYGPPHDLGIISRRHADFRDSNGIISLVPQGGNDHTVKHLIDEKGPGWAHATCVSESV